MFEKTGTAKDTKSYILSSFSEDDQSSTGAVTRKALASVAKVFLDSSSDNDSEVVTAEHGKTKHNKKATAKKEPSSSETSSESSSEESTASEASTSKAKQSERQQSTSSKTKVEKQCRKSAKSPLRALVEDLEAEVDNAPPRKKQRRSKK